MTDPTDPSGLLPGKPRLYILFNGQPVLVSNAFHAPRMRRRKGWTAALRAYLAAAKVFITRRV
jgi:hypothetical protein